MTPDPKWLDILKIPGWKMAGIAIGCAAFLWSSVEVPSLPWLIPVVWLALFLSASWTLMCILEPLSRHAYQALTRRRSRRKILADIRAYIPYMTALERRIIAGQLDTNQKSITHSEQLPPDLVDSLRHRGILEVDARGMLLIIPDDVWNLLVEERDNILPQGRPVLANKS